MRGRECFAGLYLFLKPNQRRHSLSAPLIPGLQGRYAGTRGAGGDDGADHDHPDILHQLGPAQDLLRQVDRCLPGGLLLHGLRLTHRLARWSE